MWTNLRTDIERVRKEMNLHLEDFKPLPLSDWKEIQDKIEMVFVDRKHHKTKYTWYWGNYKLDSFGIPFERDPYQQLDKLISKNELVWFFVNETVKEMTKFWFYEGHIQAIQGIIGETIGLDEYYIASKKYDWMLCVNHHDILIGTGKPMTEKLRKFEK